MISTIVVKIPCHYRMIFGSGLSYFIEEATIIFDSGFILNFALTKAYLATIKIGQLFAFRSARTTLKSVP
jgi:hypothetical protein